MQAGKIAPSMMCADLSTLEKTLVAYEREVDYLHLDIMDGRFVPNFTMGPDVIKAIRESSSLPIDLHLMTENPENHLELFPIRPGDIVSIHQEACTHLQGKLQRIQEMGAKASVALNPGTPSSMLEQCQLRECEAHEGGGSANLRRGNINYISKGR